jgi:gliding motility associated protien GldN
MKNNLIKAGVCLVLVAGFCADADAQRQPRRRTNNPTTNNQGNPQGNEQQNNNNTAPPTYNPAVSVPITYDTSGAGTGAPKPSLRNDNAFDKGSLTARTPLPYEHLRWDDALFAEKVWRELDLREKMNQTFRYQAQDDNGSQIFLDILLKAVKKGEVTAWTDDRFTTPLSMDELNQKVAGGYDTADRVDINDPSKIVARVVTLKTFDPNSVVKLRVKEEWVFDRESSRMFCRILGIAPVQTVYNENGKERGQTVMFWIYYPDLRPTLAKYEVYNPKNMGQSRMTWEELFESRMFSSYILKSTMDNAANKNIRQYIKDPILALLEGDNIKEKIFNFEQDLWSY